MCDVGEMAAAPGTDLGVGVCRASPRWPTTFSYVAVTSASLETARYEVMTSPTMPRCSRAT